MLHTEFFSTASLKQKDKFHTIQARKLGLVAPALELHIRAKFPGPKCVHDGM